jgi:hypothetical protein
MLSESAIIFFSLFILIRLTPFRRYYQPPPPPEEPPPPAPEDLPGRVDAEEIAAAYTEKAPLQSCAVGSFYSTTSAVIYCKYVLLYTTVLYLPIEKITQNTVISHLGRQSKAGSAFYLPNPFLILIF